MLGKLFLLQYDMERRVSSRRPKGDVRFGDFSSREKALKRYSRVPERYWMLIMERSTLLQNDEGENLQGLEV
jgi:hypothetical protein